MPVDDTLRVLGVVPARGGSKGVLRKNIRLVGGKPLIAFAIEAAQKSVFLSDFVVSTDDDEIFAVSEALGARVLRRPSELAADATPMVPAVQHVVAAYEKENGGIDAIVLLQPTAPARTADDIDKAITRLKETGADSIVSVYLVEDQHPSRMYRMENDRLIPYGVEPANKLRQNLDPVYHRNGALYLCRRSVLMNESTFIGRDTRPYVMPKSRSINIDDETDLAIADFLMSHGKTLLNDSNS